MSKYSIIVFDLGNVLLPFTYTKMIEEFEIVQPGLGEKFKALYHQNYNIHRNFERGELSNNQFLDIMMEWLEHKIDRENFCKLFSHIFTENKELTNLLPILKQKYRLVLLSNTNQIHMEYGWQKFSFLQNFEKMILSHEVKAVKPEEKIFRAVEEFTKEPSANHFFIDDILEYVDGAKNCGWGGAQFVTNQKLLADFKSNGIL